jgi:hypothetical protein
MRRRVSENAVALLDYISGRVDQERLVRNEDLAAENRILPAKIKGRLQLSEGGRSVAWPKSPTLGGKIPSPTNWGRAAPSRIRQCNNFKWLHGTHGGISTRLI